MISESHTKEVEPERYSQANSIEAFLNDETSSWAFLAALEDRAWAVADGQLADHIINIMEAIFDDLLRDSHFSDLCRGSEAASCSKLLTRCVQFLRSDYPYLCEYPRFSWSLIDRVRFLLTGKRPTQIYKNLEEFAHGYWPYTEDQYRESTVPLSDPKSSESLDMH